MTNLIFKKFSKRLGILRGYYFKEEFLSNYKTEAIKILRDRIEKAGSEIGDMSRNAWEKGQEILPDEFSIIKQEFEKITERTRRTHEKKKPYYEMLKKRQIEREIFKLSQRIEYLENKKLSVLSGIESDIIESKKQKEKLIESIIVKSNILDSNDSNLTA
jgi:hypothetical protein